MTDRLGDEQLDREIRGFLTWQAEEIAQAPTATEMAVRISSRVGTRTLGLRLAPQLVWVLLAGLLVVALVGAMVTGASFLQGRPLRTSYEAVFLRLEVVGVSPEVHVVGVNAEGREREIATLPGAWVVYGIDGGAPNFLAPMGAVSPGGLLAIPSGHGDLQMEWEIFDLHRPGAEPIAIPGIEQFVEHLRFTPYWQIDPRGGAFWGPGERLAILWYDCLGSCTPDVQLTFVDGRTGAATPMGSAPAVLPFWASDGSGVYLGSSMSDVNRGRVQHQDGTVTDEPEAVAEPSCRTRDRSGAEISVIEGRITRRGPDGRREELPSPGGVGFACLAPDDSMIVHDVEIGSGLSTASQPISGLIDPGSGARFEVEGSFAGWLEVSP